MSVGFLVGVEVVDEVVDDEGVDLVVDVVVVIVVLGRAINDGLGMNVDEGGFNPDFSVGNADFTFEDSSDRLVPAETTVAVVVGIDTGFGRGIAFGALRFDASTGNLLGILVGDDRFVVVDGFGSVGFDGLVVELVFEKTFVDSGDDIIGFVLVFVIEGVSEGKSS